MDRARRRGGRLRRRRALPLRARAVGDRGRRIARTARLPPARRRDAGAQPEWFYKGDGDIVVGCGGALASPSFALDGGEEPELVGLYVISPAGTPHRLGFAIGNEFSDHVTERKNYLYLAHSKLRP